MNALGVKKHSQVKGLGNKHNGEVKGLGNKGIYHKQNILMPKKEPIEITGIMNKSKGLTKK